MFKPMRLLAALFLALPLHVAAAQPTVVAVPAANTKSPEVLRFLELLKSGKGREAVGSVMDSSRLYALKAGLREMLVKQIEAALAAYGPVTSYELVGTERIGTMVERQFYLVQHRDMVVRWEFGLVRTGAGWRIGHFGFNDQVPAWFADARQR
jgi:hypothetical protein